MKMRYDASCVGQFTYVHVFGYRLGIAMDPTVVEVGLGRERCGLGSAYHGSPDLTVNGRRRRGKMGQLKKGLSMCSVDTNPVQWVAGQDEPHGGSANAASLCGGVSHRGGFQLISVYLFCCDVRSVATG